MTTIWLQAGHGAGDPGATDNGRTEAGMAEKLVNGAYNIAKPHLASGHRIRKMRNTDYVSAVNTFNREAGALDLFIHVELNANSGTPGTGTEVLYGHKATARTIQTALVKELGLADRGIKQRNDLYVTTSAIAGGERSGVIPEIAFINNKNDMKVVDEKGEHALAVALVSLSHGKYTPIKREDEMYKGKTAKQWEAETRKYRNAWKTEISNRQKANQKLDETKKTLKEERSKYSKLEKSYEATESQLTKSDIALDDCKTKVKKLTNRNKELEKQAKPEKLTAFEHLKEFFKKVDFKGLISKIRRQ